MNDGMTSKLDGVDSTGGIALVARGSVGMTNLIHVVREKCVMLDDDLAVLYGVETKAFNQAVKRNEKRFPGRFRFRLTSDGYENLRSQNVTSNGRGGRRYLPYAFTEQGIAMLSAILRSDIAVETSIRIMDAFVEARRFLASNQELFERVGRIEYAQHEYQARTDEKLDWIFSRINSEVETPQSVFFDGQLFDAFNFYYRTRSNGRLRNRRLMRN